MPVPGGLTPRQQSGRPWQVYQAASRLGEVHVIDLPEVSRYWRRMANTAGRHLRTGMSPDRPAYLLRQYREQIHPTLLDHRNDLILSPSTLPVAMLPSAPVPVAVWTDAPFPALVDHYDEYRSSPRVRRWGLQIETAALGRADVSAFPSSWPCEAARSLAPASRIERITFGPNMPREVITEVRRRRNRQGPQPGLILFIGYDFVRKGGDLAVETVERVRERVGKHVQLIVIGANPLRYSERPFIHLCGPVDVTTAQGLEMMIDYLAKASVLLLPTRAETFGAVIAEAASCGIPVVVSDTDGAGEAVQRGGFGYAVTKGEAEVEKLANAVSTLLSNQEIYRIMSRAGISASEDWLNYDSGLRHLLTLI